MPFFTKWKRPASYTLDCDPGDCVERAGYVPVKEQANRLRLAGINLAVYRAEQYDGEDAEQIDPSRTMDEFEQHDYFCAVDAMLREKYEKAQQRASKPKGEKVDGEPSADPATASPDATGGTK